MRYSAIEEFEKMKKMKKKARMLTGFAREVSRRENEIREMQREVRELQKLMQEMRENSKEVEAFIGKRRRKDITATVKKAAQIHGSVVEVSINPIKNLHVVTQPIVAAEIVHKGVEQDKKNLSKDWVRVGKAIYLGIEGFKNEHVKQA